jgi:hypothetical protein
MSFNSFPMQNFQFVNYSGPPKPKLTWCRERTKAMPSEEHDDLKLGKSPSTRPALTSCQAKEFDFFLGGYSQSVFILAFFDD